VRAIRATMASSSRMPSTTSQFGSFLPQQHHTCQSAFSTGFTASPSSAALTVSAPGTGTASAADCSFMSATSDDLEADLRAEAERLAAASDAMAIETQYDDDNGGGFGAMRSFLYDDSDGEDQGDVVEGDHMAVGNQNGEDEDDDAGSEEYSQSHHVPSANADALSRLNVETQYDDEPDRIDDDDEDGDHVSGPRNENTGGSLHVASHADPIQLNSSAERSLPAPSSERQFPESPIPRTQQYQSINTVANKYKPVLTAYFA
jgi:hypothetical protein